MIKCRRNGAESNLSSYDFFFKFEQADLCVRSVACDGCENSFAIVSFASVEEAPKTGKLANFEGVKSTVPAGDLMGFNS
jgi:hypothetical protein